MTAREKDTRTIFFESEEHEIAVRLMHINLLLTRARRNELAHLSVTPQQIGVMRFLQKIQPCTVTQLRKAMGRSNSSLVAVLNRLETRGLIKRQADSRNRKTTLLSVTDRGKKLYENAVELGAFSSIIRTLPGEDLQRLKSYIEAMITAAETFVDKQSSAKSTV